MRFGIDSAQKEPPGLVPGAAVSSTDRTAKHGVRSGWSSSTGTAAELWVVCVCLLCSSCFNEVNNNSTVAAISR